MTKRTTTTPVVEPAAAIVEPGEIVEIESVEVEQPVKIAKPKKEREQRECLCGCGEPTYSRFKQGHDARLHGQLLKASRTGDEAATARLAELGWNDHKDAADRQAEQGERRAERLAARLAKLDEQIASMQVKRAEIVAMQESAVAS